MERKQKGSLTKAIFAQKPKDQDTSHDPKMQEQVQNDWSSTAEIPKHVQEKARQRKLKDDEFPERAGNVVPFFPSEWNKANIMYDHMLGLDAPAKEEISNEAFPNLYKNHGLLNGTKPED